MLLIGSEVMQDAFSNRMVLAAYSWNPLPLDKPSSVKRRIVHHLDAVLGAGELIVVRLDVMER